jgi:hypothetical protein
VEIACRVIVALQKLRCYNRIMTNDSVRLLTNEQLLADVATVAGRERETTARLIGLLSEIDSRRLYLGEGYPSLFTFCTQRLHLSEHAAYGRIEAARAARRFPIILDLLTDGSITLTTVCLVTSHLTPDNCREVLEKACHKSKREVERLIAAIRPMPAVPSLVRRLPHPKPAVSAAPATSTDIATAGCVTPGGGTIQDAPPRPHPAPAVICPLAPERYKVQFTIDRETHDKLRQVQDLLRHVVPNGDPAIIFDRALTALLHDLKRQKLAQVTPVYVRALFRSPRACGGSPRGVFARRRPMRVYWHARPMRRTGVPGIPSRDSFCAGRANYIGESATQAPHTIGMTPRSTSGRRLCGNHRRRTNSVQTEPVTMTGHSGTSCSVRGGLSLRADVSPRTAAGRRRQLAANPHARAALPPRLLLR